MKKKKTGKLIIRGVKQIHTQVNHSIKTCVILTVVAFIQFFPWNLTKRTKKIITEASYDNEMSITSVVEHICWPKLTTPWKTWHVVPRNCLDN